MVLFITTQTLAVHKMCYLKNKAELLLVLWYENRIMTAEGLILRKNWTTKSLSFLDMSFCPFQKGLSPRCQLFHDCSKLTQVSLSRAVWAVLPKAQLQLGAQQTQSQDMAGTHCSSHQPVCPDLLSLCLGFCMDLESSWDTSWRRADEHCQVGQFNQSTQVLTQKHMAQNCTPVLHKVQRMRLEQGDYLPLSPATRLQKSRPEFWALISGAFLIFNPVAI